MSESAGKSRINPWSIGLIIVMMLGGLLIYYNYLQELLRQDDGRPAYYAALTTNLNAVEQSGEEVSLEQLKGKVYLLNYIFTRCPGQCIGVAEIMREHQREWGSHPLFHMVSVSLDPAHDSPEDLRAFTEKQDLQSDKWWFLTGDETEIRKYMAKYFKFTIREKKPEERNGERDLFDHEGLIALVDHKARIRGVYSVYHEERGEEFRQRLEEDLARVMEEAMEDTPSGSIPVEKGWPITADIDLVRQDGEDVKFSDLKGKVSVVSHVFTRCPSQCPGICAVVNEIREEFSDDPRFMAASLTMDPAFDTPGVLTEFAENHELVAENWWFLTGAEEPMIDFMANQLQFGRQVKPEAERTVPTDLYKHDFMLDLIDHNLRVIYRYDAIDEADMARLKKDVKLALEAAPAQE